ncbi:MAG: hypothetical protein J6W28_01080 [Clostridia bacterium]|nr:hypothetical protein [Clostridia bacterium]
MINANQYGFLPDNDAAENSRILQELLDLGGEITVELAGVYELSETVEIGDNTTLRFCTGASIRRRASKTGRTGMLIVNRGCDHAQYNRGIKLIGLHIDCNGIESDDRWEDSRLVGMSAHVCMIYVKDLVVEDFSCTGLLVKDYGIQISAFENIRLEHLYFQGDKDGVHLGWGRGFVIRHAKFCTYDDPIALNAFDYSSSNTHVGWIEDGLIEDCTDLAADETAGHFCRILGGAWSDWQEGMQVQHSDTVCYGGRVYRVDMRPDGKLRTSRTPPTHERMGEVRVYDDIHWVLVRDEAVYDCGCRNILFRDIHLQKKRDRAMQIALNDDTWARSYVAGCCPVPQGNLTFERVYVEGEINSVLYINYPSENITFRDTDLGSSKITFHAEELEGLCYPSVSLTLQNVTCTPQSIVCEGVTVCAKNA